MRAMVCGETSILWLFCFTLFYDAINVLSLFFLLWKNGIQQNCHQSCHNNRRFAEDSCYPGRECSKGSRCLCDSHTKSYGQPYNGGVAVVHLLEHDELDSGHGDGSKDGDRCSSQHALWNRRQKCGELWYESCNQKDYGRKSENTAVDDFGCSNYPDILAVGGSRKTTDQRTQNVGNTVHYDTALKLLVLWLPVHTSYRSSREVADRLY